MTIWTVMPVHYRESMIPIITRIININTDVNLRHSLSVVSNTHRHVGYTGTIEQVSFSRQSVSRCLFHEV